MIEKFRKKSIEIEAEQFVVWVVGDATMNGSESGTSFKQALFFKEIGFNLHDTMIYQKVNYVPLTHNRYEQSFEFMFILSKGKPKTFNPIMIPCKQAGKVEKYGLERRQNHGSKHAMRLYDETEFKATKENKIAPNIFAYTLGREKTGHPAPFPEALANDHITTWSNEGDLVYDCFMGSGTVAKICVQTNRNYIGSEISEDYIKIIETRIKECGGLFFNSFAAWRRLPNGCSIFAQNFMAAFAKPLLPAGRFISRKLN